MEYHFHFHFPSDLNETKILDSLNSITQKQSKFMADTQEQFNQVLTRIDGATNNVANQLRALKDQVAGQGLSIEVEQSILGQLEAAATRLEGVGADPANPVPDEPAPGV